jgi:purine-binding chemotaxis protein CheW
MSSSDSFQQFGGVVPAVGRAAGRRSQYLTLKLGNEDYAIDILRVREIRTYEDPTKMVNSPPVVKGVVNLRGLIVPIVDLRMKFGLPKVEYTEFTVVIVLSIRSVVIGAVSNVVTRTSDQINSSPQFDASIDSRFITGLANMGARMLIVMDMQALMSQAELGVVLG